MALLSLQNFRSNVIWSSTNSSLSLAIELKFGCESEISDLYFHLVVEEQVSELEISVDDSMGVEVLHSITDLDDIALDLKLVQSLSSS